MILNARNVNKLSALKEELEKQYGAKIYLLPFDAVSYTHLRGNFHEMIAYGLAAAVKKNKTF